MQCICIIIMMQLLLINNIYIIYIIYIIYTVYIIYKVQNIVKMQQSLYYINKSLISQNKAQKDLQSYSNVTLQDNTLKIVNLQMKVTTHRILLLSSSNHAFLVDGDKIKQTILSEHGVLWNKQYYLKIRTDYGKLKLYLKNYKQANVTINGMVKNAAWTKSQAEKIQKSNMYSGMFHKIEKDKQKINENALKVGSSFTSFDSLFANLREIKDVMNQMRQGSNDQSDQQTQIKQILKDIGFVSTISKEQSGRQYYKYLAHDLYNICQNTLFKKYGGIVSILDLFYFYNMKRQMQLVSPEQLLTACNQFHKFGYNAKLVTYPNNIRMVESTHFNEQTDFEQNYKNFFSDYTSGYSVEQIARKKGQPLSIVQIKLKKALRRGVIALDSRIEGEKYYKNLLLKV